MKPTALLARWRESSSKLVVSLAAVAAQYESAAEGLAAALGSAELKEPVLSVRYSSYPAEGAQA